VALGRVAIRVGQVEQAWPTASTATTTPAWLELESGPLTSASRSRRGASSPACQDLTSFPWTSTKTPELFDDALDEIHQRIAELEREVTAVTAGGTKRA
jgi:hypothetical protein